jgi:hypothetical protein
MFEIEFLDTQTKFKISFFASYQHFVHTLKPKSQQSVENPFFIVSLTQIPSGESIWGSRSKKDRLLKSQ